MLRDKQSGKALARKVNLRPVSRGGRLREVICLCLVFLGTNVGGYNLTDHLSSPNNAELRV